MSSPLLLESTPLPGATLLKPRIYPDNRGYFLEAWHKFRYEQLGLRADFVQDNIVTSHHRVLRGLHYQYPRAQVKLVTVLHGAVFDVVVDIRRNSPTFGQWFGVELSARNCWQLWIEPGFAHGYQVISDQAVISYKCSHVYEPADDRTLLFRDPAIGITWPLGNPILSDKDDRAKPLAEFQANEIFTT